MDKALLSLFNAVFVKTKTINKINKKILKHTIKNGYVLDPSINPSEKLLKTIDNTIGLSGKKMNATFHKSWEIVKNSSMEDLIIQQITHYITTYGFESIGIYDKEFVYVPDEKLKLPKVKNIPLTIIKGLTENEILEEIDKLACGIALSEEVTKNILAIIKGLDVGSSIVTSINNRELRTILYDYFKICPDEPVEYLRYLVQKLTGESLLIKNAKLIALLEASDQYKLDRLIEKAPDNLGSIFYRFKPLFLAMKKASGNKTFFNRLRKQARFMHQPLKEDFLNNVTNYIKNDKLKLKELKAKLESATIFRKIGLANALNYRLSDPEAIVYKVRNGKGYAEPFEWESEYLKKTEKALKATIDSIAENVSKNVGGKTFYIPKEINYALPATEKQFMGNIPEDSYVSVGENMVIGVHWVNQDGQRVDLDLSLLDMDEKIGWNASYRNGERTVLYSGDMTDAPEPKGATELFYIDKNVIGMAKLLKLNFFNCYCEDINIDYTLLVGKEKTKNFNHNHTINPNKILVKQKVVLTKRQENLGLIANYDGENRFYFSNFSTSGTNVSYYNEVADLSRNYLITKAKNAIMLKDVLEKAGATVVDEKVDGLIDLSPEKLTKTTIIDLIKQ